MKLFLKLFFFIVLARSIPVSVMLPLDTVTAEGLTNPKQLLSDLQALHSLGVDSVMADVWWGLVEVSPKKYNWNSYLSLCELVSKAELHLEVVMSFHKCGGNVGYLSLGVDHKAVFPLSRTGIDMYKDFMQSFSETFSTQISQGIIDEIQVGLGPAGELRYPSYQLSKWDYCGVGEFQCYDKYMLNDLSEAARNAGHPEWGNTGPLDAGSYKSHPSDTGFFTETKQQHSISKSPTSNFESDYGKFFLTWYSDKLLQHGNDILTIAHSIFGGTSIAAKISGIHWWYGHISHAAELTAGYYNANGNNVYSQLSSIFKLWNTTFDFTCLEMLDDPISECKSLPEHLIKQTHSAAYLNSVKYSGENAFSFCGCGSHQLELCNPSCVKDSFSQVYKQSTQYHPIERFTYLRMTRQLIDDSYNRAIFKDFVSLMHSSKK